MVDLGFSLYPERYDVTKSKAYIDLCHSYGAKRLFMSLLQLAPANHQMFHCYAELIAYANQLGIRVIADVSPSFISQADWSDQLIERAHAFGLAGLRLDEALPLAEIVTLTRNPFGLKIELNMSTDKQLLMSLLATDAERSNIIGCHNFYPHEFTGLSWQHFKDMSRFYHEHDIETAAFITAQSASEGPWLLAEGLPTVEDHRHLPIGLQVELMKAIGIIDNILISNQFISEEELAACTQALARPVTTIKVRPIIDLTEVEEQIIGYPHCYRGDVSDYVIRSTMPRLVYAQESIAPRDQSKEVKRGCIIIDNDRYHRYKGELQIALKNFTVSSKANVVAEVREDYLSLLDDLRPWQEFCLEIDPS
ncbi:DUF871 domain-containing protein [Streptococcus dysgalactiae subsp. equisimilis]|uniref:DUF871 domain-containing protein n=1 Tax=Streptococcus dysgalactiae TaxID=1334 RepID=UPI0003B08C83|nr:DUF871 domain-containing protein [Streptococcus dysgalactiae]BAN93837.1 outer surface protein [Streptococcus dysgalactiae subsp. equisimilis 167]KKC19772.1 membrane protein [Streptococcus dysgalactiae subsp. equisimilis]OBY97881.1 hypothetical protein BBG03_06395 [Streptococcus dysgalactiae subsp. equisimilis]OBZ05223.1 hypothetical protein BBG04_05915 [Streptococcus dysgalactiae subsp. equisimilis]OCX01681.1 hypothetical protein BBG07_07800 [Streptococcus dysgalactiae subsp. equisimilis]